MADSTYEDWQVIRGTVQYREQLRVSEKLATWEPPYEPEHKVTDPFSLMHALVRGSDNQGRYYADPALLRRLHWWQDDWDYQAVEQWLGNLVTWGEVAIQPLGRNCYSPDIPFGVTVIQNRTRFKRWAARPPITTAMRVAVYARDGGACKFCGATENLSVDHIQAWSKGGAHEMSNFQTLCRSCNSSKGNR